MSLPKYKDLFMSLHPGFFEKESIRSIAKGQVYDEQIMWLRDFDFNTYDKKHEESISFGYYEGTADKLLEAVGKVEEGWLDIYKNPQRVYCGFINGEIASFCIIEDMGMHEYEGKTVHVGGPGCVGTVPEYRNRGIGLTMVKLATQILKEEGYDIGYIHYTGVGPWYAKLGYETIVKWNCDGIVAE